MNNATPTLEMLDPSTLTVDINVRKDAALTPDFVASIKEHGVMEPVIAHRKEDGTVHVLMGQRRTLGAVEAKRPLIPVMIISTPEEAERIVTQVVENIQRAELTEADEADAYHQLSLIGVSAAAIAKKTGRTKTTVEGALKAKASEAGTAALGKGLTIEAALILAEFEEDDAATADLESALMDDPDQLFHVAQQLRDDRARAATLAAFTAEVEATGVTIVEQPAYDDYETARVSYLNRPDGEPATEEDANAVFITQDYRGECTTVPVIVGWKEAGYKDRYSSSAANKGPMTEEQKAERKTLIENNKKMQAVLLTELRRRVWIRVLRRGGSRGCAAQTARGTHWPRRDRRRGPKNGRPLALCRPRRQRARDRGLLGVPS
ncbi:ParB/RepB/Spo0J family partition protein [Paenarthrobacter ureafaciens]|uniref:ParB/RepB/Spo0J family partition protein n=1 Tax=Paenarthrobacter ureafaciens TaxID=37931 RepID=UPI001FB25622|nr:ParB/RepB/Spo0J family partition protein [Paenarthrobacter ureafaciens]UOD83379.1 ParB/RepB/Spo0J family partition protein [Paenarthrobacter ureafaciens]WNZ04297.1 ParB/RepB/Spo0J family partition protein [Paenarthrobacter ureafaciens]